MDDDEIRALVKRLCRPHPSGGAVIERAAILAAGADFDAVMAWILDHAGIPEVAAPTPSRGGLHSRGDEGRDSTPRRFVLPAGALG
jgi:hypothetical protein